MYIQVNGKQVDCEGNMINKSKQEYPYNYDPFTLWIDKSIECNHTVYSDRLYAWNSNKYNECYKEVFDNTGQYFDNRKPKDIERFLCLYFNKNIKLGRVKEYCNPSNGYPHWRFDYKE